MLVEAGIVCLADKTYQIRAKRLSCSGGVIGGMFGTFGWMFMAKFVGWILNSTSESCLIIFAFAASQYLLALLILHLIVPGFEPPNLENS